MDYIEREQWIEACQMFFDAYVKFQIDRTEAQAYGVGNSITDIGHFCPVKETLNKSTVEKANR